MKKMLAVILMAAMMVSTFSGCSGNGSGETEESENSTTASVESSEEASEETSGETVTYGVLYEGRIRRLTPRECLRLQGWADDRIDTVLAIQSDNQAYKQAGNGVTVNVVEAIGRRIAKMDAELRGEALAP